MSERYSHNMLVIGNDLRNEIRDDALNRLHETWGSGDIETDWKMAATECANEVLKVVFRHEITLFRFRPKSYVNFSVKIVFFG